MMRLVACLLAVGALAIAGCGGSSNSGNTGNTGKSGSSGTPTSTPAANSGSSSSGGGKSVPVAADPSGSLKFTTTTLKAKAGTVQFDFTNKSSVPHAIAIKGHGVNAKGKVIT